ncbi:MAG: LLM class flavin-dependent oxidoreductase [Pseudomonadales bacterium]|jgi:F420-dependent oxidoreductase-like protein|nr:LLM class flavin-dependent oxidoreductase [Pseudomonadales bacterium]
MRTAIGIGGADSGRKRDFDQAVAFVVEAERLGVDCVWSAEAWGQDAVAPLAWIGARTERIRLGTGIMQISARMPSMTAMTALTMAAISGDRFMLGLGASGPQVVEGLHGRPFRAPLTRMRETVEIVRLAFAGEKLAYQGEFHRMPLTGEGTTGQGKALRLSQPGNASIPVYLATLAPRALQLTGAIADGWLGTSFTPEGAEAHLAHLRSGAESAGRSLADLDIQVGGTLAFGDPEALAEPLKRQMAFTLGAMGSARTNFYNDAYRRGGWEEDARAVQALWVEGKRDQAVARVPTEMVLQANLIGDGAMVAERMRAFRDAGVNTLRLAPIGADAHARLDTLAQGLELLRAL